MNNVTRKVLSGTLAVLLLILPGTRRCFTAAADDRPAEDRGSMGLGQAIRRLGVVASVLHTGAHPDDEDSGLLAYLARGRQARTAYLSLTRGDGGQNVIGPELYESLGVIRTEELLAARRLDGAQQFFTRAFDFGFSKSRTETLSKWDRDAVLSDMVRVIRAFRPMVIVSAWSGTPNDGHGHHQSAGLLTQEAYRAAADPSRFPDQIKEGLRPWQVKKLYTRSFDGAASPREFLPSLSTLSINTGAYDPLLGSGYYEIAARGRSQHRSQDEGTIEARGPRNSRLRLIDSKIGAIQNETDIFQDLDVSLTGIAANSGATASRLKAQLADVQKAADEAQALYSPLTRRSVSEPIARGLKKLRELSTQLPTLGMSEAELFETEFLLDQKKADFEDALLRSEGVVVDCLSDDEVVTPGETFNVTLTAYANSTARIVAFEVNQPGWSISQKEKEKISTTDGRLLLQSEYRVVVPQDAKPTAPYWLAHPRKGEMFDPGQIEGSRFKAPGIDAVALSPLIGKVTFEIAGERVDCARSTQYRYADRAIGEIRHQMKVAPPVSVTVGEQILVFPKSTSAVEREVAVSVINNQKGGVHGSISLEKPTGWQVAPQSSTFDLEREGERVSWVFKVSDPAGAGESSGSISAVATIGDKSYHAGYEVVAYPHIEPRFIYHEARAEAEVIDVKVAPGLKVGFIEGAGDDFAEALQRIGVSVKTIDSKELASGDLNIYDAIVAGVRTYEVRPDVTANNSRLMEYVNRGGTYIVQYSRGNFENGGYAPYRTGREDQDGARGANQSGRDREPRLFYLNESEMAGAISKSATKPRVGYIGEAAEKSFTSMREAGLDPRILGVNDLAGDLSGLDVIVAGPNARAISGIESQNSRVLDFSRRKLVILAYTQSQFINGDFPSFPKPEARPFRVTDEQATVKILEPENPRFNFPNKITQRDFDGWVQERGAYFLGDWDSHFKSLMASHDPGEPDLKGGELIAEYGKGLYVYTAYAWFRQLPKGVPGAYRLIANLVSLSKSKSTK